MKFECSLSSKVTGRGQLVYGRGVCVSGRSEDLFCLIQPFEKAKWRDFQVVLVIVMG